ncbi:baseplate protein [Bacillus phage Tomato]|nr:baseplate protein [Bacillus phage Tomato]
MSFIKYLHPLWKSMLGKVNDSHTAVVTSIEDAFTDAEKDAMSLITDANLETATGEWLDEYGDIFGVFRKDNEADEDYRRRIINWILTERGTIGSIKDAIEKWLDDPEADVEIYEPFKNVFFLNKSKLNGPDHLLGRYYTSAVIDVRFTKHVPVEIIDEIRKFKAAGITAKLTRIPNRKRSDYVIQEAKILRNRNYATKSNIWLEMWRPAGIGTIPTLADKTTLMKPRNIYTNTNSFVSSTAVFPADVTNKVISRTHANLTEPTQSEQIELGPEVAKLINRKKMQLKFNLVKDITQIKTDGTGNVNYWLGMELRIQYTTGVDIWVPCRELPENSPKYGVGKIDPLPNYNYSDVVIKSEYETDPNRTVKNVWINFISRGMVGNFTIRGAQLNVLDEIPTALNANNFTTLPAQPVQLPLSGVPVKGIIGGTNLLVDKSPINIPVTGLANQTTNPTTFVAGSSADAEGNKLTLAFDYEYIPKDPNAEIPANAAIITQGSNPYPQFSRTAISKNNMKGRVHIINNLAEGPVPFNSFNIRCDYLDGTVVITNLKLVKGDYWALNNADWFKQPDLDKLNTADGNELITESRTTIGSYPSQIMQFDIFKVFTDRYGSNFFANKPTLKDKQEYIKGLIRNLRVSVKIYASANENKRMYFSARRWDALKNDWDISDTIVTSAQTGLIEDAIVLTPDNIEKYICQDGYVYIALTGVTHTATDAKTELKTDMFSTRVEFKRGTTVFTTTGFPTTPLPDDPSWKPIPASDYDKLQTNSNTSYISVEQDPTKLTQSPFIMASYYLPDVIEKAIGPHIFRGVDDHQGRVQVSKNLLSDLGFRMIARGVLTSAGATSSGFEMSYYNVGQKRWVILQAMDTNNTLNFVNSDHRIDVPVSWRNSIVDEEGYIRLALRGRNTDATTTRAAIELTYSELRVGLSLPNPSSIPKGENRNLLLWTKDWGVDYGAAEPNKGSNIWHNNVSFITNRKYNGGTVAYTSTNWGSLRYKTETLSSRDILKVGDKVVLSVDCRIPELSSTDSRELEFYWTYAPNNGTKFGRVTNQWQRFAIETTMTAGMMSPASALRFEVGTLPAGGTFEFANYMLIKKPTGDINVPYEQAPEEYLISQYTMNQNAQYTISSDLLKHLGKPITIAVDVELVNAVPINLGNGSNRVGTELQAALNDGTYQYYGAWQRTDNIKNFKGRMYNWVVLTPSVYKSLTAGIYIQCFGDYVYVGYPSVYVGQDVRDPWKIAPEDIGAPSHLYDTQELITYLAKNKDRTYYTLVDNDIIGYKRMEKIIPVAKVNPNSPKPFPKIKFADKEWYMIPQDKINAEGADHVYYSANIKGGMLDNKGYRGVYISEFGNVNPEGGFQDVMLPEQLSKFTPANRIAEYLPSYNKNKVINSNVDTNFPYGDSEVFTLFNMPRMSRVTKCTYTQAQGYGELKCIEPRDAFLQLGSYNEVWTDIKGGDDVTISVEMRTDDTDVQMYLRLFFYVNGYYEKNSPLMNITKEWTRYTFSAQALANTTGTMGRIRFVDTPTNLNKTVQLRNIMINKGGTIPYIEGNNKQERIDELDIIHESMIKITKE